MKKVHVDGLKVASVEVNFQRINEGFSEKVEIALVGGEMREIFRSVESDVVDYAFHLQSIVGSGGKVTLAPVKDLNRYFKDVDHLVDQDNSKLEAAIKELRNRSFKFAYDPDSMLEEMLRSAHPFAKRYITMKDDYHEILAYYILHSRKVVRARSDLVQRRPHTEKFVVAIEEILGAFRAGASPIKNFLAYRDYADFEIEGLVRRIRTQSKVVDLAIQDLVEKGSVRIEEAVPRLLEIYRTVLEIMSPVLNVIRVALEMRHGIARPGGQDGLTDNILALRNDPTYGPVFQTLEPNLRHASAHAAFDTEGDKLLILDHRGKKAKVIQTMDLDRFVRVVWEVHQALFPAVLNAFAHHEITMKDLVITCKEYSFLVLAIGNC